MSGIRHDRSVIEAFGGIWPAVARKLGVECAAIVNGLPLPPPRNVPNRPPPRCEIEARRRRLGLTQRGLGKLSGLSGETVKRIEGGHYRYQGTARALIMAALDQAENIK